MIIFHYFFCILDVDFERHSGIMDRGASRLEEPTTHWRRQTKHMMLTTSKRIIHNCLSRGFISSPPSLKRNCLSTHKRNIFASKRNNSNNTNNVVQKKKSWTEKEEAPKWLQKMAPTKGGTKPPNAIEGLIISIVVVVGGYAWFFDPGSIFVSSGNKRNDDHH